jgi:succinylglutamate desuccinylase
MNGDPPTPAGQGTSPRFVPESREIARLVGDAAGPTFVVVGGMHGNEPGGALAAKRAFARIAQVGGRVRGELLALAGNLAALREGRRYKVKDLNRQWSEAAVKNSAARAPAEDDAEDAEQRELVTAIEAAIARARGPVYLADLHTTSAPGIPFALTGDTLPQRKLAMVLPIPVLLGLEEQLDGPLSAYWTRRGCVTLAVEGGQHDDPASAESLEAVIYLAADATGAAVGIESDVVRSRALLDARRAGLPHVMEVVERHAITEKDRFVMEPGFRNLDRARRGQLLARDAKGDIRAPEDGLVILPLYQPSGEDGFFWGREMGAVRLRASELLRKLKVDRALRFFPGVRGDGTSRSRFLVEERFAHPVALGALRLLGFRRLRRNNGVVVAERCA